MRISISDVNAAIPNRDYVGVTVFLLGDVLAKPGSLAGVVLSASQSILYCYTESYLFKVCTCVFAILTKCSLMREAYL